MTNINQLRGGINGLTLTKQAELTILDSPSMQAFLAELARGRAQLQKNLEESKNGNTTDNRILCAARAGDMGGLVDGNARIQPAEIDLAEEAARLQDWADDRIDQRI